MMKRYFALTVVFVFGLISYINTFAQLTDISTSLSSDSYFGVKFKNENTGYVVGSLSASNTILKTNDGGKNWEFISSPSALYFDINFVDTNNIYIVGYSASNACGLVYKSNDAGKTWKTQLFDGAEQPYSMGFYKYIIKDNVHYVSGYTGSIFRSNDNGENWEPTNTPDKTSNFRSIGFLDSNIGFAACDPSGGFSNIKDLYRTIDGGNMWTKITNLPINTIIASISVTDFNTAYLFGYASGTQAVLKTSDGGNSWQKILTGVAQKSFQTGNFFNSNLGFAGGENGEFYLTKDAGKNWQKYSINSGTTILSSSFINENTGYIVGNFGAIWKYSSLADVEITKINSINVFPNPAKDYIEFPFEQEIENVQIYSINGESLNLPVVNGNKVDISSLSVGKYFIKIGSQNINFVKN